MGDDFDNLIDNEEMNKQSYSSLDSVISVVNDDGEEEIIDLYQFYLEKTIRKKKIESDEFPPDCGEEFVSTSFRKRKESSTTNQSESVPETEDIEESTEKSTSGNAAYAPYYKDHHILRALEIQAKAQER
jgi:hypothetical protein